MKAILFDLDGTLLPMDTEVFISHYMKALAPKVGHIVEGEKFIKALWAGTQAMMTSRDGNKSNETVFTETFLPLAGVEKEDIWPVLDQFYENDFNSFSYLTSPSAEAKQVVQSAIDKGYKVAIATNPVFPKRAIEHRLAWAGLAEVPLEKVTYYENSYFTKPHKEYYQAIADELNVHPSDCIMAGNDMQEDMAAAETGMQTYLVEGHVIDRGAPMFPVHDKGTLAQLKKDIVKETGLFKTM